MIEETVNKPLFLFNLIGVIVGVILMCGSVVFSFIGHYLFFPDPTMGLVFFAVSFVGGLLLLIKTL